MLISYKKQVYADNLYSFQGEMSKHKCPLFVVTNKMKPTVTSSETSQGTVDNYFEYRETSSSDTEMEDAVFRNGIVAIVV